MLQTRVVPRETYKRGDRLFKEGERGEKAYLIEKGKIALIKQTPQGSVVVAAIGEKAIFGEMALIDGLPRMASAVAAEDSICIVLNARTLGQKLRALPQKLRFAFESMVEYVRKTLPYDIRRKAGDSAVTAHDARIRVLIPTKLDLANVRWEDQFMKAMFEMMCEYARRRLPPHEPDGGESFKTIVPHQNSALEARRRIAALRGRAINLPNSFRLVTLREAGDALAHAQSIAAESGAGTFVHVARFDIAEFAVVFEPKEPLHLARRTFLAACTALGDAILDEAPPDKAVTFDWPDAIRVGGCLVGGGRLVWPVGAHEDEHPDWLVFGAMIRTITMGDEEPGVRPLVGTLEEESSGDPGSDRLVESFARHLMSVLHAWRNDGFDNVARLYLDRLVVESGARCEIENNGDLMAKVEGAAAAERRPLVSALGAASWFDHATREPQRRSR